MKQIFVSYAHKDSAEVTRIADRINESGFNLWIDKNDLMGGDDWREKLVDAIENSTNYMIFLSSNSIESDSVQRELIIASDLGKPIIPVLLQNVEIPNKMLFSLAGVQWINCSHEFENCLELIIRALGESIAYYTSADYQTVANLVAPKLNNVFAATDTEIIDVLEELLKDPQNEEEWILYYFLGDKYQDVERFNDGLRTIQRANELRENDLRSKYALATAYNLYTRAESANMDSEVLQKLQAEIQRITGMELNPSTAKEELARMEFIVDTSAAQAIRYFEQCLDMNPDIPSRMQLLEDLNTLFVRFPHLQQ